MKKFFIILVIQGLILMSYSQDEEAGINEWYGFNYNEAGISGPEFEMVKEKGMSRAELEKLLEIGIMPDEYFSEPWKKLGVSKSEWLTSKEAGMSDDDIDTRVYTQQRFNYEPIITFFLPGYYEYQHDKLIFGASLTTVAVGGVLLAIFFPDKTESGNEGQKPKESLNPVYPLLTFLSMAVSAGDAYMGTRYNNNKGAERFSFNLLPSIENFQASFSIDF